ncbi:MAG: enoyl-CoA hydratase/isomerase family protein [Chloroflexi bacterium]|nr:enoyl-CoA hydratase/isomerase family protein [Chloroflexota bacterium]
MTYRAIDLQKKGRLAVIALRRPLVDSTLASEIREACLEIRQYPEIRAAVLSSAVGGVFCRGTDWKEVSALQEDSGMAPEALVELYSAARALASIEQPVIAAIGGDALGQGLELALACDIRLAGPKARFGFPPASMKLFPFDGATQLLPRLTGKSKALELLSTGEVLDAQAALRIGLINEIAGDVRTAAQELAMKMAEKAPLSLRFAKEAIVKGLDLTLVQGLRLESDLYFLMHTTTDRTEGITAFREKRKPDFKGA